MFVIRNMKTLEFLASADSQSVAWVAEIEDAQWFTTPELAADHMLDSELSGPLAILPLIDDVPMIYRMIAHRYGDLSVVQSLIGVAEKHGAYMNEAELVMFLLENLREIEETVRAILLGENTEGLPFSAFEASNN